MNSLESFPLMFLLDPGELSGDTVKRVEGWVGNKAVTKGTMPFTLSLKKFMDLWFWSNCDMKDIVIIEVLMMRAHTIDSICENMHKTEKQAPQCFCDCLFELHDGSSFSPSFSWHKMTKAIYGTWCCTDVFALKRHVEKRIVVSLCSVHSILIFFLLSLEPCVTFSI